MNDTMHSLWQQVLNSLHADGISYCVLRGGADVLDDAGETGRVEIDLLVSPEQLPAVSARLAALGFLRLGRWGYAPHHFFIGFDRDSAGWLKLDVVTRIALGRPVHSLATSLGESCLRHRRQVGETYVPAAADELAALLLHCVIDKRDISARHRARLRVLRNELTDIGRLEQHLSRHWPVPLNWKRLTEIIDGERWDELLSQRAAVIRHLAAHQRWQSWGRAARDRVLRKLHRLARMVQPQAVSVALLAPDGAGKSTVAARLRREFYFPARIVYMGLYGGGPRREPTKQRVAGLGVLSKLVRQQFRFVLARCNQAVGRLVVFDRYTYDALLPPVRPLGRIGRARRWLLAHACPAPDLVVVLDAPGVVLFRRKGEHDAQSLERQRQGYLGLARHVRNMVVVDAAQAADRVYSAVTASIWQRYLDREQEGRTQ